MAQYMDYGVIGNGTIHNVPIETKLYTLVYRATHKGEAKLPFMYRSFISFSFGGKDIEDFDLIATIDGDRMNYSGYASFDDLTSTYDVLNGLAYWGSYYRVNTLSFELATDGIDQRMLDEFLRWFAAGKIRELILSEHPNRAIMARVSLPPQLSLLPFEKKILVRLNNGYYNTSTTLYKGTISLELVMDEPHWYSKINIFGKKDNNGVYRDTWYDVTTGREKNVLELPDAVKILHEDGIPLSSMITLTMLLGGNTFAIVELRPYSCIISYISLEDYTDHAGEEGYYENGETYDMEAYYKGAVIFDPLTEKGGRIAGAIMSLDENGISYLLNYHSDKDVIHFYYPGTAPSPVILKFTLNPEISSSGYISVPSNKYELSCDNPYNTITLEGIEKKEFNFTTPNLLTSYNLVISIFKNPSITYVGVDWASIRELIRENVMHGAVRAWANRVIDYADSHTQNPLTLEKNTGVIINAGLINDAITNMGYMLKDSYGRTLPMAFTFNSLTGEAVGNLSYRNCIVNNVIQPIADIDEFSLYCLNNIVEVKENVGDMVKSKYLIIEERDTPSDTGIILPWAQNRNYSHRMYHNVRTGLRHISLDYKNMYL